jgi:uncharacterized membrane-anchored protein YhcB (DUF1043 family)
MQIDLSNAITIALVILGFIGTLINMLRNGDLKRIASLEKEVEDIKAANGELKSEIKANKAAIDLNLTHLSGTERRIDTSLEKQFSSVDRRLNESSSKTEVLSEKLTEGFDKMKEALADVRETVAGFGSTYVPRKELQSNEGKSRNSSHGHQQED